MANGEDLPVAAVACDPKLPTPKPETPIPRQLRVLNLKPQNLETLNPKL